MIRFDVLDDLVEEGNGYLRTSQLLEKGISKPTLAKYVRKRNMVRAYDKERTICDIFRYNESMDIQIFQYALKKYMAENRKNLTRREQEIPHLYRWRAHWQEKEISRYGHLSATHARIQLRRDVHFFGGQKMIYIDDRIISKEKGIFNALIGKNLESICHDPFVYTNSVYGIAGMKVEDTFYKISNEIEVRDYFGEKEDVAVFKIGEDIQENIHSLIEDTSIITVPINQKIKHIDVVDEHQCLYENGEQTYDVWITRGFIIELEDGLQISFEKEIWFSEDINIERGYHLLDRFFSEDRVTEGWSEPKKMICNREVIRF